MSDVEEGIEVRGERRRPWRVGGMGGDGGLRERIIDGEQERESQSIIRGTFVKLSCMHCARGEGAAKKRERD